MAVDRVSVVVTGIRQIDRRLKLLAPRVQKKVVRRAMRTGLKILQAAVKAEAPVDKGVLKRNVVVRAASKRRRDQIEMEVRVEANEQTKRTSAKTGKQVFYPATVQYGRQGVQPDPFMTRAFNSAGEAARRATIAGLKAGVEEEASRA